MEVLQARDEKQSFKKFNEQTMEIVPSDSEIPSISLSNQTVGL